MRMKKKPIMPKFKKFKLNIAYWNIIGREKNTTLKELISLTLTYYRQWSKKVDIGETYNLRDYTEEEFAEIAYINRLSNSIISIEIDFSDQEKERLTNEFNIKMDRWTQWYEENKDEIEKTEKEREEKKRMRGENRKNKKKLQLENELEIIKNKLKNL